MTREHSHKPSSPVIPATICCIVLAAVAWTVMTSHLSVMSRNGLNHIENILRSFLISHRVLTPEWKHYQPPGWDLLQHFAFYAPYGLFAGLLGSLIRRWKGVRASQVVEVLALSFGFAAALVDEMRQEGLVDRRPGFDDLFSGWAGIAVIFALYLLMAHLLNRNKLRRMKLTSNESGTIVSK